LSEYVAEFRSGPDDHTAAIIDALGDLEGRRILDFACGAGVTAAWLASRGARVTALDLSPASIGRCSELAAALGLGDRIDAIVGEPKSLPPRSFDAVVGRYALHHVDCNVVAPQLAAVLRPGGVGFFVETFGSNPLLRLARRHLIGRLGIPRCGTLDERPLTVTDVEALRDSFGAVETRVARMTFMRIFDRQVLRYRWRRASRMLGAIDDTIAKFDRLAFLSYHQIVVCGPVSSRNRSTSTPSHRDSAPSCSL
jgi:SAM-dependent methyltransferase